MEKIKKPLFVTESLLEKCLDIVRKQYPEVNFHIKILIECFIVREASSNPDYFTRNQRWYSFGEFKKGEICPEGGISSDFYIRNAIESYVNEIFKREAPRIIFPGDSSSEEVSIVDSESHGIAIIGCCEGKGQAVFLETLKETIINSIRIKERYFPFEPKKGAFRTARDWQLFIEGRKISQFKELPPPLGILEKEKKDLLIAQIKTGLLNEEFEFSDEEKLVQRFIEDQENF